VSLTGSRSIKDAMKSDPRYVTSSDVKRFSQSKQNTEGKNVQCNYDMQYTTFVQNLFFIFPDFVISRCKQVRLLSRDVIRVVSKELIFLQTFCNNTFCNRKME
jgi:hypothetical protein